MAREVWFALVVVALAYVCGVASAYLVMHLRFV